MVLQLLRLWVLVSVAGLPLMLDAQTVGERPQVLVSVVNNAGVDDATILLAENTASRIYEQAGPSIIWKNCRPQPEPKPERCVQTVDSRHLVLRIEHHGRTLDTDVYGVAFLGKDGFGTYCDVFYDRIVELHHQGKASEATILGIVAAHELGHLLLGSHAHSAIGIMRPQLQPEDFWAPKPGTTTFSRQQAQRISDRLALVQAEASSTWHSAGL